jgi:hypothetical protein
MLPEDFPRRHRSHNGEAMKPAEYQAAIRATSMTADERTNAANKAADEAANAANKAKDTAACFANAAADKIARAGNKVLDERLGREK